mgnify:CR=1 FL=1
MVRSAKSMRRVLDDFQVIFCRHRPDFLHIAHLAVEVDGEDGFGPGRDLRFDELRIDHQQPDGQLGGMYEDDVELTCGWPILALAQDDARVRRSLGLLVVGVWYLVVQQMISGQQQRECGDQQS